MLPKKLNGPSLRGRPSMICVGNLQMLFMHLATSLVEEEGSRIMLPGVGSSSCLRVVQD